MNNRYSRTTRALTAKEQSRYAYVAYCTATKAESPETGIEYHIEAPDMQVAHETALDVARIEFGMESCHIRVYPNTDSTFGIIRGAIMVTRSTAKNAIAGKKGDNGEKNHTGYATNTLQIIERETAHIYARIANAETPERLHAVVNDYSQDTREFEAEAESALIMAIKEGAPVWQQYKQAYKAVNKYVHSERAISQHEISTEYISDGNGDLMTIGRAIASIMYNWGKWVPKDGGTSDAETQARLGKALYGAMKCLNPTQRHIVLLTAEKKSYAEIGEVIEKAPSTVCANMAVIRQKVAEYISANAPEFMPNVELIELQTRAENVNKRERSEASKAQQKATQAERMRRYRERKKAQKANKTK